MIKGLHALLGPIWYHTEPNSKPALVIKVQKNNKLSDSVPELC